jgi:outer membrane protein assembly factor BamD
MIELRNLFATHELDTAMYYLRRGAYVAAIERAKYLLETYPQTDVQNDAVAVLAEAYTKLGNTALADDAKRVLQQNDPQHPWLTGRLAGLSVELPQAQPVRGREERGGA